MDQNPQQDKNQSAADQTVEQHVEEMLGPPPQESEPVQAAPAPAAAAKPQPVPEVSAGDEADENKERLLVIPASQPAATEAESKPAAEVSDVENAPLAGETIEPTVSEPMDEDPQDKPDKNDGAKHHGKLKRFLHKLWRNPTYRKLTIAGILAIVAGIIFLPTTRYFLLNSVGVRSSASLTVLDSSTQLPLKNVEVNLAGQSAKTDDDGKVKLAHIKLGRNHLDIQKRAFATVSKTITIGWGSNPLGNYSIQPTGSQYTIFVKDWLTGKAIAGASASGGDADANADLNGKLVITIDTTEAQADSLQLTIRVDKYRDEPLTLDLTSKASSTAYMVLARKDVFVSNRSGRYDVYSADIDGKNQKLVLAGSGLEKDDIVLVQHPTDNQAALVSTRVNARNSDGYLLSTLTLINLSDNTTEAIAQSEQVQIVGWIGDRLLYVQITAGASAADLHRFKLMSYDYKTADKKELASSNSFNDVMLDGNLVYYAPSSAFQKDPSSGLIRTNADGSDKKTILNDEVWNILRIGYDKLNLSTPQDWYEYNLGSAASPTKLNQAPANPKNRLYINSPDGKHSLWVDQRDGKGLLIDYDSAQQSETTLETAGGLVYPVKWLNNEVLIYRIHNDQQTADYVLDINGGSAHKITDLYNARGIDRWYYY